MRARDQPPAGLSVIARTACAGIVSSKDTTPPAESTGPAPIMIMLGAGALPEAVTVGALEISKREQGR